MRRRIEITIKVLGGAVLLCMGVYYGSEWIADQIVLSLLETTCLFLGC